MVGLRARGLSGSLHSGYGALYSDVLVIYDGQLLLFSLLYQDIYGYKWQFGKEI